ncbi:MAG: glutamine synthetase family protein [Dehalococcoidia bacterium]|jgi:glutamine synthetase|nr:glutamine synthetase family protein [Dehalococcoidia bacterium]
MLTRDALVRLAQRGEVDTVVVGFTDLYGRFMGKRFDADFFIGQTVEHGTHGCDYLLAVDMEMEPVPGYQFANWSKGYGDIHLSPDMETLRVASWLDKTAMVQCDAHLPESPESKVHGLVPIAPRSMLRKQLERVDAMGFKAFAGSELEYYVFNDSYADAARSGYAGLERAGWYDEDYSLLQGTRGEGLNGAVRRHLRDSGVPVETSKGEAGLGQHELNVRYSELLTMADRHVVYKQCVKEVADGIGMSVTFMAKFAEGHNGSSCHIHLSLRKDGEPVFADGTGQSDVFRWFLGGWMAHAREFMPFYAPTVNSYKRYQSGSWAPTTLAWAFDNRTVGFRVVGNGDSLRIECRLPGADCNPYLAYTAALASGLDGIENRIEPPPALDGDGYTSPGVAGLPATLREANDEFRTSEFVRTSLGDEVVQHYAHFFETEQKSFDGAVTDWERLRYFERI